MCATEARNHFCSPLLCPLSAISPRGVSQPVREGKGAAVISTTALPGAPRCVCETAAKVGDTHPKTPGAERLGDKGDRVDEPHMLCSLQRAVLITDL